MNTSPNPKKNPARRRRRPEYPALSVGDVKAGPRQECGLNFAEANGMKLGLPPLNGQYVLGREAGASKRSGRSKYGPHVGKRQILKAGLIVDKSVLNKLSWDDHATEMLQQIKKEGAQ